MNYKKAKRRIYLQNICILLVVYLVLMVTFSVYEITQQKDMQALQSGYFAQNINNTVDNILEKNIDSNNQIMDMTNVTKELLLNLYYMQSSTAEFAVFDRDYNLIYSANNDWMCFYMEQLEGNTYHTGYGYLNPYDWFEEEDVAEIENYLKIRPQAKEVGDLVGYNVRLENFWVDGLEIIPETINVMPMYATSFNEYGNIQSTSSEGDDIIFKTNVKAAYDLPHFEYGNIVTSQVEIDQENELHSMVTDKDRLQKVAKQAELRTLERIDLLSYRCYFAIPYQNTFKMDEADSDSYYSDFWTVVGFRVNLLENCLRTLIYAWVGCLILFVAAAIILSKLACKTYQVHGPVEDQSVTPEDLIGDLNPENMNHLNRIFSKQEKINHDPEEAPLKLEEISLGEMCQEFIDRYDRICKDSYITTSLEGDAFIKADASQLERVIDNFIVNALDYTHYCGTIRIHIYENTLEFSVSGNHIPEDNLPEIWLTHKETNTSHRVKGSGLGLQAAVKILEQHHFTYGAKTLEDGIAYWFQW